MAAEYGDATIRLCVDGHLEVERADRTIGITLALLGQPGVGLPVDEDGFLVLAFDRAYRYRPVRFATRPGATWEGPSIVICERVED